MSVKRVIVCDGCGYEIPIPPELTAIGVRHAHATKTAFQWYSRGDTDACPDCLDKNSFETIQRNRYR